jgi:hypothetical protein
MNKYEKLIEHIINDENDKARALFHEIVVEKSRDIYESLMDQEESVGGNQVNGMMDEIQADESGLPEDEEMDMGGDDEMLGGDDMGDDMGMDDMDGEQDLESKVMDLEAELESLKAEFEQLMGDEAGEEEHSDMEFGGDEGSMDDEESSGDEEFAMEAKDEEDDEESLEESKEEDDEEEEEEESMEESRNYRKSEIDLMREYVEKVTAPSNSTEGHEVGKGGSVSVNKTSITDNMKNDMGGTTANIAKGGSEADPKGTPPNKTGGVLKQGGEIDVAKRNVNKPGGNKGAQNWYNTKASAKSAEGSTTDGSVSVAKDSILKRIN